MIANPCPSCRHHVDVRRIKTGPRANYYAVCCDKCNISLSKAYKNPIEMLAIWNGLYP